MTKIYKTYSTGMENASPRFADIKLIALDLDQTTLRADKSLSPRVQNAIETAIAARIHVAVASGRAFTSLPEQVLQIPGIEYAVTSNGATVYRVADKVRCQEFLLEPRMVEQILERIPEELSLEGFVDGQPYAQADYVENPTAFGVARRGAAYIRATRRPVKNIRDFLLEHSGELDALDVISRSEEEHRRIWQQLWEQVPGIYITSSVPGLLEISNTRGGKRCGLEWLGSQLHIRPEEMAAFGDAENDCDMIKYAGLGVAMGNASPVLKEAADIVTLSNEEDGVALVIEKILEARILSG